MKTILLISALILLSSISIIAQTCEWAEKIGGSKNDIFYDIAMDSSGNIYVVGTFESDTIFFNNGIILTITPNSSGSIGDFDGYLAKYNTDGICQWAEKISGVSWDYASSITL